MNCLKYVFSFKIAYIVEGGKKKMAHEYVEIHGDNTQVSFFFNSSVTLIQTGH